MFLYLPWSISLSMVQFLRVMTFEPSLWARARTVRGAWGWGYFTIATEIMALDITLCVFHVTVWRWPLTYIADAYRPRCLQTTWPLTPWSKSSKGCEQLPTPVVRWVQPAYPCIQAHTNYHSVFEVSPKTMTTLTYIPMILHEGNHESLTVREW